MDHPSVGRWIAPAALEELHVQPQTPETAGHGEGSHGGRKMGTSRNGKFSWGKLWEDDDDEEDEDEDDDDDDEDEDDDDDD